MATEKLTLEQSTSEVLREVAKQDSNYGSFGTTAPEVLLALACLDEELEEAKQQWRDWKSRPDWFGLRKEAVQIAAIALRLIRDVEVELVD